MVDQPPFHLYLVALAMVAIGVAIAIWPGAVVRKFEEGVHSSRDPLSSFNRAAFDPFKRERNVQTFRLVGLLAVLMGIVVGLLVWAARL